MNEFEVGAGKEGSTGTCIDPRPGAGEGRREQNNNSRRQGPIEAQGRTTSLWRLSTDVGSVSTVGSVKVMLVRLGREFRSNLSGCLLNGKSLTPQPGSV